MACPCGKDPVISESDIEETCDKAMHNMYRKIDFILSVIGDDVKEYVRAYYDVDPLEIPDTKIDQRAGEGTSTSGMSSGQPCRSDCRFQEEPSVSFSYVSKGRGDRGANTEPPEKPSVSCCYVSKGRGDRGAKTEPPKLEPIVSCTYVSQGCGDRGANKERSEQKIQRGRKRRHFSAAGGGAPRTCGQQTVAGGLSPELIQRIRHKLLGSSGSADTLQLHSQGQQRAGKRSHASSEREERDVGQSRGTQMSDRRFQETHKHPVSQGGGALESRGGTGGDVSHVTATRSHGMFPETLSIIRSSKEEVGAETAESERNNNSPGGRGGERDRVIVERLNPPF